MNANISAFDICEVIIYLLLHDMHDSTFKFYIESFFLFLLDVLSTKLQPFI